MFELDDYVTIVEINDQICQDTGYSEQELSGNFYIIEISSTSGIGFPYFIENENNEEVALWVGKDEIDYA